MASRRLSPAVCSALDTQAADALAALRPLADACAQQPDTESTKLALSHLIDAVSAAGEAVRRVEETERERRFAAFRALHEEHA